ncbi:hypothetical protein [Arthrobacter sp. USHLN218]|uniref:hypothetical protein n=1 Tax=Arthrobacter sp. USHLN218 TaxID=3081232 RepID=UPI0030162EFF
MTPEELRAAITYANGIDPRVQMTHPNAELWGRTVGHKEAAEVKAAILVYYERPHPSGRERPPVGAADIRKIIAEETERATAKNDAQKALPPARNPNSLRARDPERWDTLVAQGRDQYRAELRARGIEPHAETCVECTRPRTK